MFVCPRKVSRILYLSVEKGKKNADCNWQLYKNKEPLTFVGEGSPLWVGGELLSHGLPQYHRRGGA